TRYVTESGYCSRCGRRVRSRHPEQISTAAGAAGVVIGPRAKALAADLKHRLGVPFAKICEIPAALGLRDQKPKLSPEAFAAQAAELEQRLDTLIDEKRRLTDPDNRRMAKRLRKQREHLLRFLYVEGLDATNNRAERMLRPAVITRKTSGGNRTPGGADAHSILASILVTCRHRAISAAAFLTKAH